MRLLRKLGGTPSVRHYERGVGGFARLRAPVEPELLVHARAASTQSQI